MRELTVEEVVGMRRRRDGDGVPRATPLRGRALRMVLLAELMRQPELTVAGMVSILARHGYVLPGRPSKVISDALRWEVRRGRVVRPRRGCYRYRTAPRSTARRIRLLADRCHRWMADVTAGRRPAPTPSDPRADPRWSPRPDPDRPPWSGFGWLWVT